MQTHPMRNIRKSHLLLSVIACLGIAGATAWLSHSDTKANKQYQQKRSKRSPFYDWNKDKHDKPEVAKETDDDNHLGGFHGFDEIAKDVSKE